MRNINNQTAARQVKPMPFAGLGFAMDDVRATAQAMTLSSFSLHDCSGVTLPVPDSVQQPSGYSLLVALSREIRGR